MSKTINIRRLLIANRGEIACRIIDTAQKMGLHTIAVYSEADRRARHVRLADEAIFIGAADAASSYLNQNTLLQAMRCLLYTSPSPRDRSISRMPSSA